MLLHLTGISADQFSCRPSALDSVFEQIYEALNEDFNIILRDTCTDIKGVRLTIKVYQSGQR